MVDWTGVAAVIAPISTLLGSIGGYWLAGRNEEARERRAADREDRARFAALAERLEEERHIVQRDAFLELQDVLLDIARDRALVSAQDQKTLKENGSLYLLPEGLGGNDARLKMATADKLCSRVLDAELRSTVQGFINLCARDSVDLKETPAPEAICELQRRDLQVATAYEGLVHSLGEYLRNELGRQPGSGSRYAGPG